MIITFFSSFPANVEPGIWDEPTSEETASFEDKEGKVGLNAATLNQLMIYITSDKPDGTIKIELTRL